MEKYLPYVLHVMRDTYAHALNFLQLINFKTQLRFKSIDLKFHLNQEDFRVTALL